MKNYFLAVIIGVVVLLLSVQVSWAWTYSLSGSQVCNAVTGNYDITWTADNTTNAEDFTVTSSNRVVVSVGDVVTKGTTRDFTENLPGTTSVLVTLNIAGNWPNDQKPTAHEATVTLEGTCLPPNPTPTPTATPTPAQTSNPGGSGDNKSDNLGCSVNDCSNHPSAQPQVLGTSTKAVLGLSTTSGEENYLLQVIQAAGALVSGGLGFIFFKKNG